MYLCISDCGISIKIWVLVMLVFFLISHSKLNIYDNNLMQREAIHIYMCKFSDPGLRFLTYHPFSDRCPEEHPER